MSTTYWDTLRDANSYECDAHVCLDCGARLYHEQDGSIACEDWWADHPLCKNCEEEYPMAKEDLLRRLEEAANYTPGCPDCGIEQRHWEADRALLEYICDDEITAAYDKIEKRYA